MIRLSYTDKSPNLSNYDERSEINRLKAADLSFKFSFTSINGLILIYVINPFAVDTFVSLQGSIMAISIVIYFGYYYWNERMIE